MIMTIWFKYCHDQAMGRLIRLVHKIWFKLFRKLGRSYFTYVLVIVPKAVTLVLKDRKAMKCETKLLLDDRRKKCF